MTRIRRRQGRPEKLSIADKHELRRYREAGVSIKHLMGMWKLSRRTVLNYLAEMRERLGPETLPPHRRQYARLTKCTSYAGAPNSPNNLER